MKGPNVELSRRIKLPDDELRREIVAESLSEHVGIVEHIIEVSVIVHDLFCKLQFRPSEPNAKGIISGVFAQGITRLHSIALLCDFALPDEATVLVRSLFDTRLALNFILRQTPDPGWQPTKPLPAYPS